MTDITKDIIQHFCKPHCLSLYFPNWCNNQVGCLFYANEKLAIIDTPWRKNDTEIVFQMHQDELEMFNSSVIYICEGDCAKMIGIILGGVHENNGNLPVRQDEIVDFFDFSNNETFLKEWLKFLQTGLLDTETFKECFSYFDYIAEHVSCVPIQMPSYKEGSTVYIRVSINDGSREPVLGCYTPTLERHNNIINFHHIYALDNWISEEAELERDPKPDYQIFGFSAFIASMALLKENLRNLEDWEWDGFSCNSHNCLYVDGIYPSITNPKYVEKLIREQTYARGWFTEEDLRIILPYYITMAIDTDKHELFVEYFNYIKPIWENVVKKNAHFPDDFSNKPQLLYSLMFYAEKTMYEFSSKSQLWSSLHKTEQEVLSQYAKRYMAFLEKEKGASELLIMDYIISEKISPIDLLPSLPVQLPNYLKNAMEELKEIGLPPKVVPHWPQYTPTATDKDKEAFEGYLLRLCKSSKKSMTSDVKAYLKKKAEEKIIIRPAQINTEYDIVKQFGYPYKSKAYYNG